jgi:hypothetical protein
MLNVSEAKVKVQVCGWRFCSLQSQHKLFGQSEQGIGAVLLVDRPFNPGFFKPSRVFPVFSVSALLVDGSSH